MGMRSIAAVLIAGLLWLVSFAVTPATLALTQIKLTNISYHECPAEMQTGAVTSNGIMSANCFLVTGQTQNDSGKLVYDADIFGRVYDANGDSVLQNRTRLGAVEKIPPGTGTFEIRLMVPANQPLPLKLEQFKAAGFAAKIGR
jgi:hypothetical protein